MQHIKEYGAWPLSRLWSSASWNQHFTFSGGSAQFREHDFVSASLMCFLNAALLPIHLQKCNLLVVLQTSGLLMVVCVGRARCGEGLLPGGHLRCNLSSPLSGQRLITKAKNLGVKKVTLCLFCWWHSGENYCTWSEHLGMLQRRATQGAGVFSLLHVTLSKHGTFLTFACLQSSNQAAALASSL